MITVMPVNGMAITMGGMAASDGKAKSHDDEDVEWAHHKMS